MTEDDTFRALCRTPIKDMELSYRDQFRHIFYNQNQDLFRKWLNDNGWMESEFYEAMQELYNDIVKRATL